MLFQSGQIVIVVLCEEVARGKLLLFLCWVEPLISGNNSCLHVFVCSSFYTSVCCVMFHSCVSFLYTYVIQFLTSHEFDMFIASSKYCRCWSLPFLVNAS